jgi:hypothetical protein
MYFIDGARLCLCADKSENLRLIANDGPSVLIACDTGDGQRRVKGRVLSLRTAEWLMLIVGGLAGSLILMLR